MNDKWGRMLRKTAAVMLSLIIMIFGSGVSVIAADKTGIGMAQWALRAYNEGWSYVYGGSEVGAVDCSGLIRSYTKQGGGALDQLNASSRSGKISTMPNIHGLGLWCDGHAGVYVGKNDSGVNMAVDARNSKVDVVYSTMDSRSWNPWVKWFKIAGVTYPTTGWETFNGKKYYYEDGEFVTGIYTVDGVTYDFGKSGALIGEAKPTTTTTAAPTTTAPTTKKTTTTTRSTTAATAKKTTTTTAKKTTTTTTKKTTAASSSLRQGMSGGEVTKLQKRLIELGYLGSEATGYYGEQTAAAVKAFQRAASLTADGVAGASTQKALYADDAPRYTTTTKTAKTTTTTTKVTTTTTVVTTTTTAKTTAITTTAGTSENSQSTRNTTTSGGKDQSSTAALSSSTAPHTTTVTMPVVEWYEEMYETLEFGSVGIEVKNLQQRLFELGYYDHDISDYYGVFLRLAVTAFQKMAGLPADGVASAETQAYIYSESAPIKGDEDISSELLYGDDDALMTDEGDFYEEAEEEIPAIAPSEGLSRYGTEADISGFISEYGGFDSLQTFGVMNYSTPTVTIYHDGSSYELSEELNQAISDCVFF